MNDRFVFNNAIVQCKFGHIEHTIGEWGIYYSQSKDVLDEEMNIRVLSIDYEYPDMDGRFKYKTINIRGKKYMQVWEKKDGKYKFSERTKVKYTKPQRYNNMLSEVNIK